MMKRVKTALLIVDMEKDFFHRKKYFKPNRKELCENINELISYSRKNDIKIIWVRQQVKKDLSDAFTVMKKHDIRITIEGTKGVEFLDELDYKKKDTLVIKKRYSAFFKTNLEKRLRENGIETLIVAGINTHACVRMAVIDAYQHDFNVIVASDCVNSYDKNHHEISLKYFKKSMDIPILSNKNLKKFLEGKTLR